MMIEGSGSVSGSIPLSSGSGGGMHMAGGGMHMAGGGMHVHPVHPPWVRHCPWVCQNFGNLLSLPASQLPQSPQVSQTSRPMLFPLAS
jgi:hypothetical protein